MRENETQIESNNQNPPKKAKRGKFKTKQSQELQFSWYVSIYFLLFFVGYFFPFTILLVIYRFVLWEFLFSQPFSWSLMLSYKTFYIVMGTVAAGIVGYLLHIFLYVLVVKSIYQYSLKKFPHRIGTFLRDFEDNIDFLRFHHLRGFISRVIKWKLTRCAFPWLVNWGFRYIGMIKIGKNVTFEDQFHNYEAFDVKDNVHIGYGAIPTSSTVEGAFGRVIIDPITIEENAVISASCIIPPGGKVHKNAVLLPGGASLKAQELKEDTFYWGAPAMRLPKKRFVKKFFEHPELYADAFLGEGLEKKEK